jgi:hypothetical protein
MNQFQPSTPRAALAASAVAFTALVLGLSIVVPASFGPDADRSMTAVSVLPVVQLEPITVIEQAALDGAEDVVLHETPTEAAAMSTRVSASSDANVANAHCPHAKSKAVPAARSHAI